MLTSSRITSFTLGRLALFNANSITADVPPIVQEENEEPWQAYEMDLPDRPGHRSDVFHYCTALSMLINSTLTMFNAPTVPLSGAGLLDQYEKYQHWYQQLPEGISSTYNAPPHVISLQ